MRPLLRIKNIYTSRRIQRKWLYGLASLTLIGSGSGYLIYSPRKSDTEFKTSRLLPPPHSALDAVIDWDEWLTDQYLYTQSSGTTDWIKELVYIWECMFPWNQVQTNNQWILLECTKSKHFWIRQMGVAALANTKLEDYKIRSISQAMTAQTRVSLARYPAANDLFFPPPPKLAAFKHSILDELRIQLTKLPTPDPKSAITHFKAIALDTEVMYQDYTTLDLDDPIYTMPGQEEVKEEKTLTYCLHAILEYTSEKEYSTQFIANDGLALLQRLDNELGYQPRVKLYLVSILSNLSLHRSLMEDIVRTGWLYTLRQWASCEDKTLAMLALTTLANLDSDWIDHSLYQNTVLIHPTERHCEPPKLDVVFVHGLKGGAIWTWRQKNGSDAETSQCWPLDWLASDLPNIRIVSLGYDSCISQWGDYCPVEEDKRTLEGRAYDLIRKLKQAEIGSRPIIWVGHSMGGLLIKKILAISEDDGKNSNFGTMTRGVILYSVPHRGASIVDTILNAKYLIFPSPELEELFTSSPKLAKLHENFINFISKKSVPILSFGELEKTPVNEYLSIMIVPTESSDPGIGNFITLETDHINTCKPEKKTDLAYQHFVAFTKTILNNLNK